MLATTESSYFFRNNCSILHTDNLLPEMLSFCIFTFFWDETQMCLVMVPAYFLLQKKL